MTRKFSILLYVSIIINLDIFLLTSCRFYSFTGASISSEVRTVSINYFPNKANTVKSSLSSMFTEKLKDYFTSQTNLNLTEHEGDLSFDGEITSYTIKPIDIQTNETARQNRLTIKVKVRFENKKDEIKNFNTTFSRHQDFAADEDLNDIEEGLMEEICNELIEDIFNKSVVNW